MPNWLVPYMACCVCLTVFKFHMYLYYFFGMLHLPITQDPYDTVDGRNPTPQAQHVLFHGGIINYPCTCGARLFPSTTINNYIYSV